MFGEYQSTAIRTAGAAHDANIGMSIRAIAKDLRVTEAKIQNVLHVDIRYDRYVMPCWYFLFKQKLEEGNFKNKYTPESMSIPVQTEPEALALFCLECQSSSLHSLM